MFDSPHFSVEVFSRWKELLKETDTLVMPSTDKCVMIKINIILVGVYVGIQYCIHVYPVFIASAW